MKIGAHPLLVAVALGLLGPNALAREREEDELLPDGGLRFVDAAPDELVVPGFEADRMDEGASAEEFARVEAEWLAVRDL